MERKTRFVQIDLLESYKAEIVRKKMVARFKKLHPLLVSTLTLDQGKEHECIASELKIQVYFCHPSSPWEKGTCESTNRLIRDMLDGEKDFRNLTPREVSRIANLLNERPRATLGFKTPKEVFAQLY